MTRRRDNDTLTLKSAEANAKGNSNDELRRKLQETRISLSPWINLEDYKLLPMQLKPGVVHLLSEALYAADSPHTSTHMMGDTVALTDFGAMYLTALTHSRGTPKRLDRDKTHREEKQHPINAKARITRRCQPFLLQGMSSLEFKTSNYLIPEVQKFLKAGEIAFQPTAKLNEKALSVGVERYSPQQRVGCASKE